jgi:CRISPR/Cas system-associated exonuclease Cas4 (RecB family)
MIAFNKGRQDRGTEPSGSSISRYNSCPGSYLLELHVQGEDVTSPEADLGNLVHSCLAGSEVQLSDEAAEIKARCLKQYDEVRASIEEVPSPVAEPIIETRFWYGTHWSGQVDRVDFLNEEAALVVDWKTGRIAQDEADQNLQLRAYAVLVRDAFPQLKRIYVAIIQPMAGAPTLSVYDGEAMDLAEREIVGIMDAIMDDFAPRNPSAKACRYCKAKKVCPEVHGQALAMKGVSDVPALTNERIGELLEAADYVENFIDDLKAEAKRRLQEGQEIPGRKLSPGKTTRSVTSAEEAFGCVNAILDPAEFAGCCKLSLPQLEKAVAAKHGLKGKAAKEALETLLGDVLQSKQGEPVLSKA